MTPQVKGENGGERLSISDRTRRKENGIVEFTVNRGKWGTLEIYQAKKRKITFE